MFCVCDVTCLQHCDFSCIFRLTSLIMHKTFRWNGRIVRKSIYERNLKISAIGKRNKKSVPAVMVHDEHNQQNSNHENRTNEEIPLTERISNCQEVSTPEISTDDEMSDPENDSIAEEISNEDDSPIKGCRIVELGWMAKRMMCDFCKEDLSLKNIERETRIGFASILYIRCKDCLLLNKIPTGKQHESNKSRRSIFDVNSKIVLGALHTGLGHSHINKLMHAIGVPAMAATTFRRHEREISQVIEEMAFVDCEQVDAQERDDQEFE